MRKVLLFLIALVGFVLFMPVALCYAMINNKLDFMYYAVSLDQSMNALGGVFFSKIWLKNRFKTPFGDMDKTLSYHLGQNKLNCNLSKFGRLIAFILNLIDKEHVEKAFKNGT